MNPKAFPRLLSSANTSLALLESLVTYNGLMELMSWMAPHLTHLNFFLAEVIWRFPQLEHLTILYNLPKSGEDGVSLDFNLKRKTQKHPREHIRWKPGSLAAKQAGQKMGHGSRALDPWPRRRYPGTWVRIPAGLYHLFLFLEVFLVEVFV